MRYFWVIYFNLLFVGIYNSPALAAECDLSFADKLEDCTPHICQFTHEILPIQLNRQIIGKDKDGKCLVLEDMPGNFHLKCNYKTSDLDIISKKYKEVARAGHVNITIHETDETAHSDIDLDGKRLRYTEKEKAILKESCNIYMNGEALPND